MFLHPVTRRPPQMAGTSSGGSVQISSYPKPAEKQQRRPENPRDGRDRLAQALFDEMLDAAGRGRAARASDLAAALIDAGYGVEEIGDIGYRLVRRAVA